MCGAAIVIVVDFAQMKINFSNVKCEIHSNLT